jgi:uncharacterized membrane protein YccC
MSTTYSTEQAAAASQSADVEMEQIRELLVGEILRRSDSRIDRIEARLHELEAEIARGLDALSARIEQVGAETAAGQHAAFEKLSQGVVELGQRIRGLGKAKAAEDGTA